MTLKPIEITVNGQPQQVAAQQTIADLIEQWDFVPNVVAVELNLELVPRERHHLTVVQAGDQLEIVTLVGGG